MHTEYSSIDKMADQQNQFLRTILKYKSCAELNAELVQTLIEKIYVYRGKRAEIIWKWKDELIEQEAGDTFSLKSKKVEKKNSKKCEKVSGGTDGEK